MELKRSDSNEGLSAGVRPRSCVEGSAARGRFGRRLRTGLRSDAWLLDLRTDGGAPVTWEEALVEWRFERRKEDMTRVSRYDPFAQWEGRKNQGMFVGPLRRNIGLLIELQEQRMRESKQEKGEGLVMAIMWLAKAMVWQRPRKK